MSQLLMLPGPTPLPPQVQEALSKPMINHRGPEWDELFTEVQQGLKWAYQTEAEILCLAGSGCTGMEAAIVNLLSPDDRVLAICNGYFGERFATIAETYGVQVERLDYGWGNPINPADLAARLEQDVNREIKAVLLVHNETATGMLNPLAEMAPLIRAHGALSIVDAISSLMSVPLPVDQWELDLVISASQKAFMVPPGLAFVSLSPKAWQAYEQARLPRFALDFGRIRESAKTHHTPWTPPVSLFWGLQASLRLMQAEGHTQILARHEAMTHTLRSGLQTLGLELLITNQALASRAVTTVLPPSDIAADQLRATLLSRYNIVVAGGSQQFKGKIFRIGHLGWQSLENIQRVLESLEEILG